MKAATNLPPEIDARFIISIHAAREGGDPYHFQKRYITVKFQSTPPVKAATAAKTYTDTKCGISIHAAREGGDAPKTAATGKREHFNPRRP